mgnify:CR=1 FL=1
MDLATMRARVREDLQDTDAENYRWSNDEVDGAIERVVREFSMAYPIQQQDDIATAEDDKELDISTLADLLKIVSVEYPMDLTPAYMQRWEMWNDKLYMTDEGDGTKKARVRWHKWHTLDAASSTIPAEHEEIIVLGATGYLATSASVYTVDKATISGRHATANFLKWGQARLDRYETKLRAIARDNRVITKELYSD